MSIEYTKTTWVNDVTPVNETNMNNIENGIEAVVDAVNNVSITNITSVPFSPEENIIYHYVGETNETFTFDKFYKYDSGWIEVKVGYTLPQATSSGLGGVKADNYNSSTDTTSIRINPSTGKLYTNVRIIKEQVVGPSGSAIYHELVIGDDYEPTYRKDDRSLAEPTVFDYGLIHENNINTYKLMAQEELSGTDINANKSYFKTLSGNLVNVSLLGAVSGKLNHWHLVVTNSGGAYTTSFYTTIKWSEPLPTFADNKTYEFSIIRVGTSPSFTYLGSWVEYS